MNIDLHIHSDASDGEHPPRVVVERAAEAGLETIALTDHDTVEGVEVAAEQGEECGVRVIAGCEFSVAASWGELHLLAYFLPHRHPRLTSFIDLQQTMRADRAVAIVERLQNLGVRVAIEDVLENAMGSAVGRPHVARSLVNCGAASDINDAFRKYLAVRRPAFVPKKLPALLAVTALVSELGGVSSAAHLRSRASRATFLALKSAGVDAVEVVHPAHSEHVENRIATLAEEIGLLKTGGSDWHGEVAPEDERNFLGGVEVPLEWLTRIENLHASRMARLGS